MNLSLKYESASASLSVLDQLKLPHVVEYIDVKNSEDTWRVIRDMNVRGAPLIAIVACLGLSVHLRSVKSEYDSINALAAFLQEKIAYLRTSRPTAVNLFTATDDLSGLIKRMAEKDEESVDSLTTAVVQFADALLRDDVIANRAMGHHGAERIIARADGNTHHSSVGRGLRVLTICNTGSLACAGYGTALGVVRALQEKGRLDRVFACETRPYNQGARLTAFELVTDNIPGTLITDSMAAALMATKGIDCVVVGADRVAANGDTANKIGTYQLAIAAKHHGVPFYVAAPTTSLDVTMPNGSKIVVEERNADELTCIFGQRIAPEGIAAWNPAFDVTPCELITGIITEVGIIEGRQSMQSASSEDALIDARIIDVGAFLRSHGKAALADHPQAASPTLVPVRYRPMDTVELTKLIANTNALSSRLGYNPTDVITVDLLHITEVGDGNLNYVYIVRNPATKSEIVIKQALPYVRCVGDSWPLSLERATFEHNALKLEREMCPEHVPEVYFFDPQLALIAMQYIPAPHIVLRKVLIRREKNNSFAAHLATFMAKTLFKSSFLALTPPELRKRVSYWSLNVDMCALTEQVIFTDPFTNAKYNNHTSPQLDSLVEAIRADSEINLAALELKTKFVTSTQALLHGDLHTGSVMVADGSTFVIDPEFAFMGPIGFDTGSLLANLFLSFFSQPGHKRETDDDTEDYAEWLLQQIISIDNQFNYQFTELWRLQHQENVVIREGITFGSPQVFLLDMSQRKMLKELWWDTLGFAGIEMIRRTIGIAHVEDINSIADVEIKSQCEKRCLQFGRALMLASSAHWRDNNADAVSSFSSIESVTAEARAIFKAPASDLLVDTQDASRLAE